MDNVIKLYHESTRAILAENAARREKRKAFLASLKPDDAPRRVIRKPDGWTVEYRGRFTNHSCI